MVPVEAPFTGRVLLDGVPVTSFEVTVVDDARFTPGLLSRLRWPFLRPVEVHSADGRFSVPARDGKARDLIISGPGFAREIVPAGSLRGLDAGDVAVSRGQRIEGDVRDEAGALVADARVTFSPTPSIAAEESRDPFTDRLVGKISVATDAHGHYVIEGAAPVPRWSHDVLPEGPMQIRAWTSDRRASLPTSVGGADTSMDLTVGPTGILEVSRTAVSDIVLLSLRADADPYMVIEAPYASGAMRWFRDLPVGDYTVTRLSDWSRRPIQRVSIQANSLTTVTISGTRP